MMFLDEFGVLRGDGFLGTFALCVVSVMLVTYDAPGRPRVRRRKSAQKTDQNRFHHRRNCPGSSVRVVVPLLAPATPGEPFLRELAEAGLQSGLRDLDE